MTLENQPYDHRPAIVQEVLGSPGFPLDPTVRILMEARFVRDFGHVRLHTDNRAAASAHAIGAQAYTAGSHIVFADGRYHPETRAGLWLLAHELAHVVQQGGADPPSLLRLGDVNDPLECVADRAAHLVAAGRALPQDFTFGTAPTGVIQRHPGPACNGNLVAIDGDMMLDAADIITRAYLTNANVQEAAVFRGINWDYNFQVPGGAPNQPFARDLLSALRMSALEERPDIIDFRNRQAYFFIAEIGIPFIGPYINRFHQLAHRLGLRHNEQAWNSWEANWFPPHILPFPNDLLGRFVCTQNTDHTPPRGLILYNIRQPVRRRKKQQLPVAQYDLWGFEKGFAELLPTLRAELSNKINFYDPENSNYVIIVPQDFYHEWYKQKNARMMEKMRVKPSYDFPGGQAVKELRSRLHHVSKLLGVVAAGVIMVGAIAVIVVAPAAVAGAGAAVSAGATAGTTATAGAGAVTSTIIVPAGIAAQVAASSTAAGGAIAAAGTVEAALVALATAPATKAVVMAAGVLMIIGFSRKAQAATGDQITAIRAVAVADFQPIGGIQSALSAGPPSSFFHTADTAKGKFNIGTKVLFDRKPHFIIGQFSVS